MLGSERLHVIASLSISKLLVDPELMMNDVEAELIRLQVIAVLRGSECKLKLLHALRANDNLTVKELLHFIH